MYRRNRFQYNNYVYTKIYIVNRMLIGRESYGWSIGKWGVVLDFPCPKSRALIPIQYLFNKFWLSSVISHRRDGQVLRHPHPFPLCSICGRNAHMPLPECMPFYYFYIPDLKGPPGHQVIPSSAGRLAACLYP